jgi:hypothetical protein
MSQSKTITRGYVINNGITVLQIDAQVKTFMVIFSKKNLTWAPEKELIIPLTKKRCVLCHAACR